VTPGGASPLELARQGLPVILEGKWAI
jgi:hypothetical protein